MVPPQYLSIVRQTLDRKRDIEFGYTFDGRQTQYYELIGARAYQTAVNRWRAEKAKEAQAQADAARHQSD